MTRRAMPRRYHAAVTAPTRTELREWAAQLIPEQPLDVGDPDETRYVPLADAGRSEVDDLQAAIELSYRATTQLLTGPTGSGKTTELFRLRRDLRQCGYPASYIQITDYVSRSAPLDVTEFLIALAVGAHDAITGGSPDPARPGFGRRLGALLRRLNVELDIAGVTASVSAEGIEVGIAGQKVAVDLAAEIQSSRPFVDELRAKLSYHLKPLYDEVATFLAELTPDDADQLPVLIVDDLEKLRGTTDNDTDVQRSVEQLFVNHADKLKFASHHVVYTAPTYLQFVSPGKLPYDGRTMVPVPHVTARGGGTDPAAERNLDELREVVRRRIPVDRIFASSDDLDAVLRASGGHLRDILGILQRLTRLMLRLRTDLPLTRADVDEAIAEVARDYAALTRRQADFLTAVARGNGTVRPEDGDVQMMARMLAGQLLLAHRNGEDWYEVHPLARRALGLP